MNQRGKWPPIAAVAITLLERISMLGKSNLTIASFPLKRNARTRSIDLEKARNWLKALAQLCEYAADADGREVLAAIDTIRRAPSMLRHLGGDA